jgi:hypothetical protein
VFEKAALVLILLAQFYRIIRSEVLLNQERRLHKRIEEYLQTLTPAGLWPQYEALKRFHGEISAELERAKIELEGSKGVGEQYEHLLQSYKGTVGVLGNVSARLQMLEQQLDRHRELEAGAKRHSKFEPTF